LPKPNEYKWIARWGRFMGSMSYYIQAQQEQAAEDNAPLGAIYKRGDKWSTIEEVENESTRDFFKNKYGTDCPQNW